MEVLYHTFDHILLGYSLKKRPYIGLIYGRYLQFRFPKRPLIVKLSGGTSAGTGPYLLVGGSSTFWVHSVHTFVLSIALPLKFRPTC